MSADKGRLLVVRQISVDLGYRSPSSRSGGPLSIPGKQLRPGRCRFHCGSQVFVASCSQRGVWERRRHYRFNQGYLAPSTRPVGPLRWATLPLLPLALRGVSGWTNPLPSTHAVHLLQASPFQLALPSLGNSAPVRWGYHCSHAPRVLLLALGRVGPL